MEESHLDLYLIWRRTAGMGGETMSSLLELANRPGSEALIRDFGMLSEREERLKLRQQTSDTLEKWLKDGKAQVWTSTRT